MDRRQVVEGLRAHQGRRPHRSQGARARIAYEAATGKAPKGLGLAHTCRNLDCVNPAHLRPTTQSELGSMARRKPRRRRLCSICEQPFLATKARETCSDECKRIALGRASGKAQERGMTGSQADAYLTNCVALENAPAWMRHPIPQTGARVVGGRR